MVSDELPPEQKQKTEGPSAGGVAAQPRTMHGNSVLVRNGCGSAPPPIGTYLFSLPALQRQLKSKCAWQLFFTPSSETFLVNCAYERRETAQEQDRDGKFRRTEIGYTSKRSRS